MEPTGMAMSIKKSRKLVDETHLSNEEEIERQKGILMRRVRSLRTECENLEQALEHAKQSSKNLLDAQRKAQSNVDVTMYFPILMDLILVNYFFDPMIPHFLDRRHKSLYSYQYRQPRRRN